MGVYDAVKSRRSVRNYTDRPVDREVLDRVLTAAARTPSGGNLQPWHTYVVTGKPHADLVGKMAARLAGGDRGDEPEYPIYPPDLTSPYRERRFGTGEQLYSALGIPREDKQARRDWFAGNWSFFGAPVGLFCYIDRAMGSAQWSDVGMYLQTIMLLLREEGLASCPQEAWSIYHSTVDEVIQPSEGLMLFSGMSIGYEDTAASGDLFIDRAPLAETVNFLGWES
ncbi:nitroreductase [Rhodococcus opacus]|uniref:nitroreductase n=1 Tax=Rhodococcus opacus TaxID=37919 RepID=UPI001C465793|nr:nitroreductase [Rhodococcus opacus]MBV6756158.1 nitroreductase [Rhodococcus opacus]